jgi:hypothetical protein
MRFAYAMKSNLSYNFLRFLFSSHKIVKRSTNSSDSAEVRIDGFRIESSAKEPEMHDGVPVLRTDTQVVLRLFGAGFGLDGIMTKIGLTREFKKRGDLCTMMVTEGFEIIADESGKTALVEIKVPDHTYDLYICASMDADKVLFVHQGTESWLKLKSSEPLLPIWTQIMIIVICLCFSALFSGLNLGLMALDRTDLKVNTKVIFIGNRLMKLSQFSSTRYCATQVQIVRRGTLTPFNRYAITETFYCAVFFLVMCS